MIPIINVEGPFFKWTFSTSILIIIWLFSICFETVENKSRIRIDQLPILGRSDADPEFRKKVNVSQREYSTKLAGYYNEIKLSRTLSVINMVTNEISPSGIIINFDSSAIFSSGHEVITSAEVKMLVPPVNDINSLEIYITVVDLTIETNQSYVASKSTIYLSLNEPKWLEFRVTTAVKRWAKNGERQWRLLFNGLHLIPRQTYLNIVTAPNATRERQKRQSDDEAPSRMDRLAWYTDMYEDYYLENPDMVRVKTAFEIYDFYMQHNISSDCKIIAELQKQDPSHNVVTCCRIQIPLNLETMRGDSDLGDVIWHILAPDVITFTHCQGKCPTMMYAVSNQSRFHHALVTGKADMCRNGPIDTTLVDDVPNLCCAPTQYGSIKILSNDFNNSQALSVQTLDDIYVTNCGCV